ncbi:uncharacterized protein LOC136039003 isoform X2 [Artemia franciscana]|uniref:uncharacterized protein LOC136039003 isoform X2 n=1 Tax=Artemia franciscana TaxID=6661 RepID=UPI0032DAB37C
MDLNGTNGPNPNNKGAPTPTTRTKLPVPAVRTSKVAQPSKENKSLPCLSYDSNQNPFCESYLSKGPERPKNVYYPLAYQKLPQLITSLPQVPPRNFSTLITQGNESKGKTELDLQLAGSHGLPISSDNLANNFDLFDNCPSSRLTDDSKSEIAINRTNPFCTNNVSTSFIRITSDLSNGDDSAELTRNKILLDGPIPVTRRHISCSNITIPSQLNPEENNEYNHKLPETAPRLTEIKERCSPTPLAPFQDKLEEMSKHTLKILNTPAVSLENKEFYFIGTNKTFFDSKLEKVKDLALSELGLPLNHKSAMDAAFESLGNANSKNRDDDEVGTVIENHKGTEDVATVLEEFDPLFYCFATSTDADLTSIPPEKPNIADPFEAVVSSKSCARSFSSMDGGVLSDLPSMEADSHSPVMSEEFSNDTPSLGDSSPKAPREISTGDPPSIFSNPTHIETKKTGSSSGKNSMRLPFPEISLELNKSNEDEEEKNNNSSPIFEGGEVSSLDALSLRVNKELTMDDPSFILKESNTVKSEKKNKISGKTKRLSSINMSSLKQSIIAGHDETRNDISGKLPFPEISLELNKSNEDEEEKKNTSSPIFEGGEASSLDALSLKVNKEHTMGDPSFILKESNTVKNEKKNKISGKIKRLSSINMSSLKQSIIVGHDETIKISGEFFEGLVQMGKSVDKKRSSLMTLIVNSINLNFSDSKCLKRTEQTRKVISLKLEKTNTIQLVLCSEKRDTIYIFLSSSERALEWLRILSYLCFKIPQGSLARDVLFLAKVYYKEGVSGPFLSGIAVVADRSLIFRQANGKMSKIVDLRKIKKMGSSETKACGLAYESGPLLFINTQNEEIIYIQMDLASETQNFQRMLEEKMMPSSLDLNELPLTKENVPVVIDTFVNYIALYGLVSEGIYRKEGIKSRIEKLESLFLASSPVHVSREDFTEHDVASALILLFRNLPEPIFTSEQCENWINAEVQEENHRLETYKKLIERLPEVNAATLKFILNHLYFVHRLSDRNLMSAKNLSPVWGPALIGPDKSTELRRLNGTYCDAKLVYDLIVHYPELYGLTTEQLEKETIFQIVSEVAKDIATGKIPERKPKDLHVWVHVELGGDNMDGSYLINTPEREYLEPLVVSKEEVIPANAPMIRLCIITKAPNEGCGFHLISNGPIESNKTDDKFIGPIESNSHAFQAGLREGDRLVEVNGTNADELTHKEIVMRIKDSPNEVKLLVVNPDADGYYKAKGISLSSKLSTAKVFQNTEMKFKMNGSAMKKSKSFNQINELSEPRPLSLISLIDKRPELEVVHFADRKSKNYKIVAVTVDDSTVLIHKDQKKSKSLLHQWDLNCVRCFIGHDPKRKQLTPYSITIFPVKENLKRTKDTPFCGYTLCVYSEDEMLRWYTLLMNNGHMDTVPIFHWLNRTSKGSLQRGKAAVYV